MTEFERGLEFGWLVAILEGEGCFTVVSGSPRSNSPGHRYPRVVINMTDEDVIRRVHAVAGVGKVNGPYKTNGNSHKPHHKDTWFWTVAKRDDVLCLMKKVHPYMGLRRRQKIDEILFEFEESEVV